MLEKAAELSRIVHLASSIEISAMPHPKDPINPFYILSGIAGVAFTVTACAYGLIMVRANRGQSLIEEGGQVHPLLNLLDQHGLTILGVEVLLIGIVSIAAIVLDHFRGKRALRKAAEKAKQSVSPEATANDQTQKVNR
jgi:hypothetical protein